MIDEWARDWGIPAAAVADYRRRAGHFPAEPTLRHGQPASEEYTQSLARLALARDYRAVMFRNNVGALRDESGRPVRYGLANESAAMNKQIKSSDLIGILPVLIGPQHLGHTIGQFVAVECKHGGWSAGEKPAHEAAQQRFGDIVLANGGRFVFTTGKVSL